MKKHFRLPFDRTCIACRMVRKVDELWRYVRHPDGMVVLDSNGVFNGRGAYVCQNDKCFELAIKRKAFSRAFKKAILGINKGVD
ncbi:MAG: YlxR family protein [Deltaproteobacteria bacterium]|nr:YlxR family protein [Deltaproteobacteria bacterium]